MAILTNICLDKSLPEDYCPFLLDKPAKKLPRSYFLRQLLKKWIFVFLRGRSKKLKIGIPENPKCIAVATGGNLGGAIISIPLIKGVRERWPDAHLIIISNRQHGIDIVKRAGLGDSFYVAPDVTIYQMLMGNSQARRFKNDLVSHSIDLFVGNFDFRLDYLLPLKNISCTVGQYKSDSPNPNKVFYDYAISYNFFNDNWLFGYWQLLDALKQKKKEYPLIKVDKEHGKKMLEIILGISIESDDLLIGIAADVWSGAPFKAFPKEKMLRLCIKLIEERNARILIFGASGQMSLVKSLPDNNIYLTENFWDLIGKLTISQLPDVIAACSAVVSNDSGLMHLSAATGTPVAAIYGMTDPSITWVYDSSSPHAIIQRDRIRPCYHKVNDVNSYCASRDCINNISVDFVYEKVISIINPKK